MSDRTNNTVDWMKLDNAAKIYPAAMSRRWTAMFRYSIILDECIDVELLTRALSKVMKRFPSFALRLRKGLFWHYLEYNDGAPDIQEDVANPCVRMNLNENKRFMFRVRYYESRIALEVFHVLADGTGALCFFKTLIAEYLELKHNVKIPRSGDVFDCSKQADPEEYEDSFLRYARTQTAPRSEPTAYRFVGTPEKVHFSNIITGIMSASTIVYRAKQIGVSMTEYLTAVLMLAIQEEQLKESSMRARKKPIKISVPVNMRKFYKTRSLRNFSSYVNPGIDTRFGEFGLKEAALSIHHYMGFETTEKRMNARMSANVKAEKNRILRATPLFIKKPTLKIAFKLQGDRQVSSTLTNLGVVKFPEEMAKFIKRMDVLLGPPARNPVNCACITYGDDLVINFTRIIKEATIERNFFRLLVKEGVRVKIESNKLI